jgi:uncharacterized OsmC-like protein
MRTDLLFNHHFGTQERTQMGMTVKLDRMIHTQAVHQDLAKTIGLEGCCAFGGKGNDLNPIDLVAMGLASCLQIVMAKAAEGRGIDLTGTWAETSYVLKDYKIASIAVNIYLPHNLPSTDREYLETESYRCPVYLAVKDGTEVNVSFAWNSSAVPHAAKACSACCG